MPLVRPPPALSSALRDQRHSSQFVEERFRVATVRDVVHPPRVTGLASVAARLQDAQDGTTRILTVAAAARKMVQREMRRLGLGVERCRALVRGASRVCTSQLFFRRPKKQSGIVLQHRIVGGSDHLSKFPHRFRVAALKAEHPAEAEAALGQPSVECKRPAEQVFGLTQFRIALGHRESESPWYRRGSHEILDTRPCERLMQATGLEEDL